MPEESIWNRRLFEVSERAKTFWHWLIAVYMASSLLLFEWILLATYPNFNLISKNTAISGEIVFAITQIGAIGGVWAIAIHVRRRAAGGKHNMFMAWLGCVCCYLFIGKPAKFEGVNAEFYAQGYPARFGLSVLFLCLALAYLSLLTWSPEKLKALSDTQ